MKSFEKFDAQFFPSLISPRKKLSVLFLLCGAGLFTLAFGADLIGGVQGLGPLQVKVLWSGLIIFFLGIVIDVTLGPQYLLENLKLLTLKKEETVKFLGIVLQLAILMLVIRQFKLESRALYHNIMLLTFFGFLIHYFLPFKFRLPFFLLLSLAGISGLFGFTAGFWFIVFGVLLIGICHLPVHLLLRIALLLVVGGILVFLRVGLIHASWAVIVVPIVASMFMFRLIIYLYDLKHQNEPAHLPLTIAYFFLLPNFVFPLFPVVDYKTFCRTYFNEDRNRIYQTGIQWMLRGVIHLLLYRLINYYLVISPEDIHNSTDLLRYLIANFLLLIKISGQFPLIIGMLHLFGFNLPRPWNLYYLSSSFNDFWRRANIYWKDFMQKVIFYPSYFKLRNLNVVTRLIVSTLLVFVITWFLHAYQWFWLRGNFLVSAPDILFWAIFGVLVVINTLYESFFKKKQGLGNYSGKLVDNLIKSFRILATFSIICILWSLWSSPTLNDWFSLWSVININFTNAGWFILFCISGTLLFYVINIVFTSLNQETRASTSLNYSLNWYIKNATLTSIPIVFLFLLGRPWITHVIGPKGSEFVGSITTSKLSLPDAALLERGYYENLTSLNRFNSQLWQLYMKKPDNWVPISKTDIVHYTHDFLGIELKPSSSIIFHGKKLSTNRWGMRDQEYTKERPDGTYRIAVVGGSLVMGSGVADGQTFECFLENRLNQGSDGEIYNKYEILNFGVGGYGPIRRMMALERKALSFGPNAVFSVAHSRDYFHAITFLIHMNKIGVEIPYKGLREIVRKANINPNLTETEAERRLRIYGDEIVSWAYRRMAAICKENGIVPVWILMPSGVGVREDENSAKLTHFAEDAGFIVINILDVFANKKVEDLRVAPWDWHCNASGHKLIADRLYNELIKRKTIIPIYHITNNTANYFNH
ncbi:MAG: hypothetical protein D6813_01090 [Calditrichaeota bacterium]|nr:MAG: hypothetical protein D6813_01090 [Calditrichota bacterium]